MGLKLLSDIYPPAIKPVRDGEYQSMPGAVWINGCAEQSWWRNGQWHPFPKGSAGAMSQERTWRGLAWNPDEAQRVEAWRLVTGRGVFLPGAEVE